MKHPHTLFDFLIKECPLKNDAALAKALGISPADVSKIRKGITKISARVMILVHKKTGMSIEDIEEMVGFKIE
jgi:DNA-binding transcriptional regulator YdaS (Cro superfamily)